jgi:hypothetical protein
MKTQICCFRAAVVAVVLLSTLIYQPSTLHAQGSLTPPPGAPAPTMRTLLQIEPRTPISSLPFTITNPGVYYVTTNLTGVADANGITITTGNVVLDLHDFTLTGVPGSSNGVYVTGNYQITVKNGTLTTWGLAGVNANNAQGSQFNQLNLTDNGADGLDPGSVSQVRDCIATGNAGNGFGGIDSNCKFEGCTGTENDGDGFGTFEGCSLLSCSANLNGLDGFVCFVHCMVKDSVAHDNGFDGIDMPYSGGGGVVAGCVCNNNGSQGIITADGFTIQNSVAMGNDYNGITAGLDCSVQTCTVETNGAAGILVDTNSSVKDCTSDYNVNDGIQASTGCLIEHNTCSGNGSGNTGDGGIRCTGTFNRVDSNHLTVNNANGLYLDGSGNTIVRNSAKGNVTTNYSTGSGNDVGPIGSAATSTSPWANLQ